MRDGLVKLIATGFYSGYSPLVPGTVGSVPAWLVAFFAVRGNTTALVVISIVVVGVSVWSAGRAEMALGHDSKKIVIDEWAGMFLAVLLVPYTLTNYVVAFLAFRVFDVVKIPPAAQSERLPGGWGVTMDDVVAGIQANLVTQLIVLIVARHGG